MISGKKISTTIPMLSEANDIIQALTDNLAQVVFFLKRSQGKKSWQQQALYEKPWYLVIGPTHSGKNTLLKNSALTFSHTLLQDNKYCQTWLTDNAVFITIPGKLISDSTYSSIWPSLLKVLKQFRGKQPFDGILLTFNPIQIWQQGKSQRTKLLENTQIALTTLCRKLHCPVPINIIFTHADLISGFTEFFSDLNQEERNQSFGAVLPLQKHFDSIIFNREFSKLLQRLHQQLLWRIQLIRDPQKKILVKNFPLQLESLQRTFSNALEKLFPNKKQKMRGWLHGVFLTSSCQQGTTIDVLAKHANQLFQVQTDIQRHTQSGTTKSYFIQQLLQNDVFLNRAQAEDAFFIKRIWSYRVSYAAIFLIAVTGLFQITHNFKEEIRALNIAQQSIQNFELLTLEHNDNMNTVLAKLEVLRFAENQFSKIYLPDYWPSLFKNVRQVKKQLSFAYRYALENQFIPFIAQKIEKQLVEKNQDPYLLYGKLKAYLMLGEPTHRDSAYLFLWLQSNWGKNIPLDLNQNDKFFALLKTALKQPFVYKSLNARIIQQARQQLSDLPKPFLGYLELKNNNSYSNELSNPIPESIQKVFTLTRSNSNIPYIYTQKGFIEIYDHQTASIAQSIIYGDWVLGKKPNDGEKAPRLLQLEQEIKMLYITDYINWWNLFVFNVQPKLDNNLNEGIKTLHYFEKKPSPFAVLLKIIVANTKTLTSKSEAGKTFNELIANHFSEFQKLDDKKLEQFSEDFRQLSRYLENIYTAKDPKLTAFLITKERFTQSKNNDAITQLLQKANSSPKPMQDWLKKIALNNWQLVLNEAQSYLNQQWQETVFDEYQTNLLDKYPFQKEAKVDVPLDKFTQFFNYGGTLDTYFKTYLEPFIDVTQSNWQLKKVNDLTLNISPAMLQELIRAKLIRKMFFSKEQSSPHVNFQLKPIIFQPIVKTVRLNMSGQFVEDIQESNKITTLTWPGHLANKPVTLTLEEVNGQAYTVTYEGPWAWFKLLDDSNLEKDADTRHFYLLFNINEDGAKYELIANNAINPFLPQVIEHFQLPNAICLTQNNQAG
ncbi:MAG: type VI secretion system membrane subunit TssM [Proteobacteria bacterium]|nr:type VI secretion system membrane subunit TssM [Pseudomonadota bacterium]